MANRRFADPQLIRPALGPDAVWSTAAGWIAGPPAGAYRALRCEIPAGRSGLEEMDPIDVEKQRHLGLGRKTIVRIEKSIHIVFL